MSEQCFKKGCCSIDTECVDATRGPLYDLRYYCPEHLAEFEAKDKIRSLKGDITYEVMEIENLNNKITERVRKIKESQKELDRLNGT